MHLLKSKLSLLVASAQCRQHRRCRVRAASSSSASSSSSSSASAATLEPSSASAPAPGISASSFTNDFTAMAQLKSLAAEGKGKVAAILPDTMSSTRYIEFDAPDIKKALLAAGLPASDIIIQNAQESDTTFLTDAQADITNGATVHPESTREDSGTGARSRSYAAAHGVPRSSTTTG